MLCCCSVVLHLPFLLFVQAAQEVANFLGTVHHSYVYTVQEGLDAIREVHSAVQQRRAVHRNANSPTVIHLSSSGGDLEGGRGKGGRTEHTAVLLLATDEMMRNDRTAPPAGSRPYHTPRWCV